MRIVDRKTFLSLPENTVFSVYKPQTFGALEIKGESLTNDFYVQCIVDSIACDDDKEKHDVLDGALQSGETLRFDFDSEGRDGCYNKDELYAVWDNQDIENLIARLQQCIK